MVVFKISARIFCSTLFFGCALPLLPQQGNLQISLLPRSVAGLEGGALESEGESYLSSVQRRPAPFRPTNSDLLVGKAEEKFQIGKSAYQRNDSETARREFDYAIDLMLQASEGPTDRRLYESKLEQMVDSIHRFDLAGLGAGELSEEAQFEKAPLDDILQMTFPVDPAIKDKVADEVHATSSQLPLAVNDSVLGYINYFSGRGRRTIIAGLERAARYQPMISRILAEEGVPQELIHLAQAESGFLPRAVSYRAAVGMWQFVQFRGREYGLAQTPWTDDRLDPERSTRAAARHLHDLYNRYGDWYLAIAAYNCGPGTIDKAVERTGYADFWELRARHVLPQETTNYVPIILAMTIMTKNAAEYGLTDIKPEPALEYDTVKVKSPTHLALVGDLIDTPVSQLLQMNPALIRNVAPADYALHVPRNAGNTLESALEVFPEDRRASWRLHRVEAGETLASIARRYKTAPAKIFGANRIASDGPQAGDKLIIPADYRAEATTAEKSKRASSGRRVVSRRGLARAGSNRLAAMRSRSKRGAAVNRVAVRTHHAPVRHRA